MLKQKILYVGNGRPLNCYEWSIESICRASKKIESMFNKNGTFKPFKPPTPYKWRLEFKRKENGPSEIRNYGRMHVFYEDAEIKKIRLSKRMKTKNR